MHINAQIECLLNYHLIFDIDCLSMHLHLAIVFCLLCGSSQAATYVGGVLLTNTVWSSAGSANPYYLTQDVQVPRNVTLTIQAGVVINFTQGDFEILVKGYLKVEGTASQKVIFQGGSGSDLKYMLKFQSTRLPLTSIQYAQFKGPKSAVQITNAAPGLQQNTGKLVIESSIFSDGTTISANGRSLGESFLLFYVRHLYFRYLSTG